MRDAGFTDWDTYTPFPVHGIDKAMGIKMTHPALDRARRRLTGLATAILLQWWTNAVDYPWIISGKPFWSIPANVPIMFELTVLFSGLTALSACCVLEQPAAAVAPARPRRSASRARRTTASSC